MIGGGVPKNFAQDIVVAADILGVEASMHKYAIQITVADARDGALSGSTLKEASSVGQGRPELRADGLQRSHHRVPADCRVRLPQAGWRSSPHRQALCPGAGTRHRLIPSRIQQEGRPPHLEAGFALPCGLYTGIRVLTLQIPPDANVFPHTHLRRARGTAACCRKLPC